MAPLRPADVSSEAGSRWKLFSHCKQLMDVGSLSSVGVSVFLLRQFQNVPEEKSSERRAPAPRSSVASMFPPFSLQPDELTEEAGERKQSHVTPRGRAASSQPNASNFAALHCSHTHTQARRRWELQD